MANGKYKQWLTKEGLLRIQGWARDGLTDEQIASKIGINRTTFYDWKKKYSDISDALKENKDVVDRKVENALLKNALNGNVTAQIFWLKNRKPNEWREKREAEVNDEQQSSAINQLIKSLEQARGNR
ncbi:MAG TPA: helix-turn-helix domain-containing protein [Candidatus Megamonas gallistercoris]|nr:helix-turn-helix domain-containing protein [Candidatus Megamonas gallistercoris]